MCACVCFEFLRVPAPVTSLPSPFGSFGTKSICALGENLCSCCPSCRSFPSRGVLQCWRTETFQQWWNCDRGWLFHGALALKCTNFLNLRLVPSWVTNLVLKSFSGPLLWMLTCYAWKSYVSFCFQSLISTHTLILKVQYLLEMSVFSWICFNQNVLKAGNKHSWLKIIL